MAKLTRTARRMILPLRPDGPGVWAAWLPPNTLSGRLIVSSDDCFGAYIEEMSITTVR